MKKFLKSINIKFIFILFSTLSSISSSILQAQLTNENDNQQNEENISTSDLSFGFGTDLVSRYVWRGTDFGDSPSIQPYISISYGAFELGTWASYPFSTISYKSAEHDLYLSYTQETVLGSFGLVVTDYYFPNAGLSFSNWKNDGNGAHTLELATSYTGLFNALAAYNFYNDVDNSLYIELGYSFNISKMPIDIFIAGAKGESEWYGLFTNNFEIINLGFKGSKEITVSDNFSLAVSASYIVNPYLGRTFLVFGISL